MLKLLIVNGGSQVPPYFLGISPKKVSTTFEAICRMPENPPKVRVSSCFLGHHGDVNKIELT